MAPAVYLDTSSDVAPSTPSTLQAKPAGPRTLLLCPPSISSNPAALESAIASHPRSSTDVQMVDRLSLGIVNLPQTVYESVILLHNPTSTGAGSKLELDQNVLSRVAGAMAPGGRWVCQDKEGLGSVDKLQVMLAGLMVEETTEGSVFVKPAYMGPAAVPLKFGRKKAAAEITATSVEKKVETTTIPEEKTTGYKVGFVDFGDDLDEDFGENDDDDELIDEDTLLDESDLASPIVPPPECAPKPGLKRRRACKDCTCGLREKLAEEDSEKRAKADTALKLAGDDLAEVDFTVEGKASSCGNCYLGDAFRCDGCPYVGMPAFKPGEQVVIPMGDDQF